MRRSAFMWVIVRLGDFLQSQIQTMQKRPVRTIVWESISGASSGQTGIATYAAVAAGLAAMLILSTEPADRIRWAGGLLWISIAFFAWELMARILQTARAGRLTGYVFSGQGAIDLLAACVVPAALSLGMGVRSASLFGVFWLLKPVPRIPGLRQLRRVLAREAGPLSSVLVLFLIVLFVAATLAYLFERDVNQGFSSLPASLWWAVVTLTTRLWRRRAH